MPEEFVTMVKAAQELGMAPEALKQVIAKRELSALMDGGTFKIRRTDLDRFKSRRQSEETITLPTDEGEVVAEAVAVEEPTLEAIEEVAETTNAEITLDDLDTVQAEPATATPAEPLDIGGSDPTTVELSSGSEATEEFSLSDDMVSGGEIPLEGEGEEAKTVNLEVEPGATQAMEGMEEGGEGEMGDLGDAADGAGDGLEARVHVLEARPQGSPFFAAMTVLTSMVLVFVGIALWGFLQDHVPGYLAWMLK